MDGENALTRVTQNGVSAVTIPDLLAVGFSKMEKDVSLAEPEAVRFLEARGSLSRLSDLSVLELREQGLSVFEAWRCLAWLEIGRRIANSNKGKVEVIEGPDDIVRLFEGLRREKKEHFGVALLDAKNTVMRSTVVHIGSLTMSIVSPREVFREAVREGAASIICVHNHPSGDPTPSREDIDVTRKLAEVGTLLDIPVLDHVILGDGHTEDREYVSLHRMGIIHA